MDQGTERAVVYFVTDAVAGARRTPGRHETGGVPPKSPATTLLSLWPSAFWDFGSLHQRRRGVISFELSRQPYLRLCRCGDFGFVSRHRPAEHRIPDVSAVPTLRRHVSRLVAAGVYLSLEDVAASQYVCSCGATTLSSHYSSFGSDLSSTCFA